MGYVILGVIIFFIGGRIHLRWEYNNGVCRKCGGKYEHTCDDSQGNSEYTCKSYGHSIWL